ncbi:hypothetical protein GN958_ATG04917 [Phytophthora infestans]|uniref:Uncharacterized protein n=1 Tax=Phytophthora infestans TaxID=4787 RepID=A0A8S9TTJ5_PHYIN|nr:hypothetical protein GN958_ATG20770 [Phytophthora infestans]KAF4145877.1 hypothetical protein GN958_ATG04917 [Phytophthora infestans]
MEGPITPPSLLKLHLRNIRADEKIGEDCWDGGDGSGDTRDIKLLPYQQETPRSAASVQSEKPSLTTAWSPPAVELVSTHAGFEVAVEAGLGSGGVELRFFHMS